MGFLNLLAFYHAKVIPEQMRAVSLPLICEQKRRLKPPIPACFTLHFSRETLRLTCGEVNIRTSCSAFVQTNGNVYFAL